MRVPVNRILPYSVVDGPGNRVAVFVQRCNISCLYCHNPETQNLCIGCGDCVGKCPAGALSIENGRVIWEKGKCIQCDTCIKICPNYASPKITMMGPEEVLEEIRKSEPFIRGVTVSGGECALYPEFLTALFKLIKKDCLSTLLDSNGTIDFSLYPELLEVTDGVMLDVKSWDDDAFRELTGGSVEIVKKNLNYLFSIKKLEEIRLVSVPGYTDDRRVIEGIAELLKSGYENIPLKLIRFRRFGVKGVLATAPSPTDSYMESLKEYANAKGFANVSIR